MDLVGETEFKKLLSLSGEIFIILDRRKKVITYASPNVSELGYSVNEVLNVNFLNLVAGHVKPILEKRFNESPSKPMYGLRLILKSKENVYMPYSLNYLVDNEKIYLALQKEKGINLSEIVIDSLDFGIIFTDTEFKILYHNAFLSNYFERASFSHLEQLPYGLGQKLIEYLRLGTKNVEIEYIPGRHLGIQIEPLELTDVSGYLIKLKDITSQKMIQKSMSELDSYFSLGQLASGLAHEIKNPLAGMKFIALSLKRELNSPPHIEMIERLIKQIDRINALVKTFFSQVKTKAVDFKKCNIKETVEEIKSFLNSDLIQNGIIFEYLENSPGSVYADRNHLYTILLNLIQNAVDALKSQKGLRKIEVQVRQSDTKCPDCGQKLVEIEVKDTGPGIKKEDLERIFYPFFTTKAEGVGLGLFLVHKMVKENKGFIRVFSEVGKGTSFVLYLHPVTPEAMGCVKK
ncbi:MAG: two-component system sensor histidine kinase NtrB [Candidatus Hydrothermia bacterium]